MTLAEQVYERVRNLPESKVAEVLDFVDNLENDTQLPTSGSQKKRPISEWLDPIHIENWDDNIDLSREAMYGDEGR
ncbi:MAG: DUF2281 domain-containing protein [Magnetococcales bacterium]|nr:DUF2281 domain-containing protein [Magnetococcales bacterium]